MASGILSFFFFQAEDGIRDYKVTGVQTCALPISQRSSAHSGFARQLRRIERAGGGIISAEVGGINGDHANRARDAEPDDAPVVAALRAAPPAGFPPIHPFSTLGVFSLDERGTPPPAQ